MLEGELGLKRKMSSNFYRNPNNVGQDSCHLLPCGVWVVKVWSEKVFKGWHLSSILKYFLSLIAFKAKNKRYIKLYFSDRIVMIEKVGTLWL